MTTATTYVARTSGVCQWRTRSSTCVAEEEHGGCVKREGGRSGGHDDDNDGSGNNSGDNESRFRGGMLEINRDGYGPRVRVCMCVTMVYLHARALVAMASWLVQRVVLSPGG